MNNTPTIKTCICLQYIGDNGPCPEHGDPPRLPILTGRFTQAWDASIAPSAAHRASRDEPEPTTPKSQAPA